MTKVKPFGNIPYTQTHNVVYDVMMRELSGSAFKTLCVIIRFTHGWHKSSDSVSYSQIQEYTGIASRNTVSKALRQLLEKKYIVRRAISKTAMGTTIYEYSVNTDLEIPSTEIVPGENDTGTKIVPGTSTISIPRTGTISVHTKETKENKQNDVVVVVSNPEQLELGPAFNPTIANRLIEYGVTQNVARELSERCTLETVERWIEYIETRDNITNNQGFLVSKLRTGEMPPQKQKTEQRQHIEQGMLFQEHETIPGEHELMQFQNVIKNVLPKNVYDMHFKNIKPISFDGHVLITQISDTTMAWLDRLQRAIDRALRQLSFDVSFIVS